MIEIEISWLTLQYMNICFSRKGVRRLRIYYQPERLIFLIISEI